MSKACEGEIEGWLLCTFGQKESFVQILSIEN